MKDETIRKGYAATPMPPHPRKGEGGPYDPSDRKLSAAHLIDSVRYNLRHARDHTKKAKHVEEDLHKRGLCSGMVDCGKQAARNVRHSDPKE